MTTTNINNISGSFSVNGKVYKNIKGRVEITERGIFVNGKPIEEYEEPPVMKLVIEGNIGSIETENADVEVKGDVQSIVSKNGNVNCGNVSGNVDSKNGNVHCGTVNGDVTTKNGNIFRG
jgi:hypothetical protein